MSHLSEYEDGEDATILRYIDSCSKEPRYQPEAPLVCLPIESPDDLEGLLLFVQVEIENIRRLFVDAVSGDQSSTAQSWAYCFKHLLKMQKDLSIIAKERHPKWAKAIGID